MDNLYFEPRQVQTAVDEGRHREIVGGLWDEIGLLQFEFLKREGLLPEHKLLDVGCGCLRGGVHFIRYLDAGNYYGIDISEPLLTAGWEIELNEARLQERLPRQNLVCVGDFDLDTVSVQFDFAIAQSLFTHLTFNRIRQCLERLVATIKPGRSFYATFFELPEGVPSYLPLQHSPGDVITQGVEDSYHYRFADLEHAAAGLPWEVRYIGDWQHPRGQRMAAFFRR